MHSRWSRTDRQATSEQAKKTSSQVRYNGFETPTRQPRLMLANVDGDIHQILARRIAPFALVRVAPAAVAAVPSALSWGAVFGVRRITVVRACWVATFPAAPSTRRNACTRARPATRATLHRWLVAVGAAPSVCADALALTRSLVESAVSMLPTINQKARIVFAPVPIEIACARTDCLTAFNMASTVCST